MAWHVNKKLRPVGIGFRVRKQVEDRLKHVRMQVVFELVDHREATVLECGQKT